MGPTPSRPQTLDLAHLVRQTFGDRALERELLALFMQQCLRLTPIIAGTSERVERADAAHTLKGAARAVGAVRIAALADALEISLDGDRSDETLERLGLKLERAIAAAGRAVALRWQDAA